MANTVHLCIYPNVEIFGENDSERRDKFTRLCCVIEDAGGAGCIMEGELYSDGYAEFTLRGYGFLKGLEDIIDCLFCGIEAGAVIELTVTDWNMGSTTYVLRDGEIVLLYDNERKMSFLYEGNRTGWSVSHISHHADGAIEVELLAVHEEDSEGALAHG